MIAARRVAVGGARCGLPLGRSALQADCAAVLGFGVAPTAVALVSDILGGEQQIGLALAITTSIASLAAFVGFAFAMRRHRSAAP